MKRATAFILVVAAAFFHDVTPASAAEAAERTEAATVEVGGGPRQRWDCVAFVAEGEIYVVNLDGTGLTRLTANDAADDSPAFSPDGTKIAYVSEAEKHCGVYVMNADGSDPRRLSPPNDVLEGYGADGDFRPVFSPNGERIAATRTFYPPGEIIFFPTSGGAEEHFSTKIRDAWERERPNNYEGPPPWGDIWDPVFSGDGQSIAYRFTPDSAGKWLCIANADGSGARVLARGPVYYYALSPDGKKLAFCEWPEEGRQFCVINADGTGRRQLTNGGRHSEGPAFSPDGKKIVYESSVRREIDPVACLYSDIYIMNADGSDRRALTRTTGYEGGARFTAEGSKIVFVAWPLVVDDSTVSGIYVMNADGSGRRFLAAGYDFSLGPSLVEGRLLDSYGNWHDVVEDPETTPPGE